MSPWFLYHLCFPDTFICIFWVYVFGKVMAMLGKFMQKPLYVFIAPECFALPSSLFHTYKLPVLIHGELQAGVVKRSSLWDLPASCPSWPMGQNSSQQEKSKCLKFFPDFYSLSALTFYWWKEIKLNKFYYILWDS